MNKIKIKLSIALLALSFSLSLSLTSCADMLETDSTRQSFDPTLDQKTDSVFYAFGIMQAMQGVADQYFFQGEMRGDLVNTTPYTNTHLRELANFSVSLENKYDSAYRYYKIINNCNYYLAHRDTTLYTGAINVTLNEYAAVAALRAWAYLQLGRTYKEVPYVTEPLTTISQINKNDYPMYGLEQIVAAQTDFLKPFAGYTVPTYTQGEGYIVLDAGTPNWSNTTKQFTPALCFVPVDVIMGEMYLETGQYENAAKSYFNYIKTTMANAQKLTSLPFGQRRRWSFDNNMPSDFDSQYNATQFSAGAQWTSIFSTSSTIPADVITYIPMAVNYKMGTITEIPEVFGYDYYSTDRSGSCPTLHEIQVNPSSAFNRLADSTAFYYYPVSTEVPTQRPIKAAVIGEGRADNILNPGEREDSVYTWVQKQRTANIILYRGSTVYLHLAEALNRMGYPDAAFAILKDGINLDLPNYQIPTDTVYTEGIDTNRYIRPETIDMLTTTIPFLAYGALDAELIQPEAMWGIHMHGCGAVNGLRSPYQYKSELLRKFAELKKEFGIEGSLDDLAAVQNAMEDLLCDEYALEFAFEGSRFYDLARLARHKNLAGTYGADFGNKWLAKKLEYKNPSVSLLDQNNWFLPYK